MEDAEMGVRHTKEGVEHEEDRRMSESEESDASLLGNSKSPRNNSSTIHTQNVPSLRAHLWITAANIILFITSLAFMTITLSSDSVTTLQDHWRATSFYCV